MLALERRLLVVDGHDDLESRAGFSVMSEAVLRPYGSGLPCL